MNNLIPKLDRRIQPLVWAGTACLVAGVTMIALQWVDYRTVGGANAWLKPMKFAFSFWMYNWTMALILVPLVGENGRLLPIVPWTNVVTTFIEMFVITVQAGRGVDSHFNWSTAFNSAMYVGMGTSVLVQVTCLGLVLTRMLVRPPHSASPALIRGVQLGLFAFLLGTVPGVAMLIANSHTIGMPDGGPGIPVVRWSTVAGDLRIAHFLGLHGMQVFPLMGFVFSRRPIVNVSYTHAIMAISFVAYATVMAATMIQAMMGLPLIPG